MPKMTDLDFPTVLFLILFFGTLLLLGHFWRTDNLSAFVFTKFVAIIAGILINEYGKKR